MASEGVRDHAHRHGHAELRAVQGNREKLERGRGGRGVGQEEQSNDWLSESSQYQTIINTFFFQV